MHQKSSKSKLKLLDDRYSSFFMTNKIMWITECTMFFKCINYSVQRLLWGGRIHSSVLTTQNSWVLLNRLLYYSYSSSLFGQVLLLHSHYIFWKVMVLLLEYVFSVLFPPLSASTLNHAPSSSMRRFSLREHSLMMMTPRPSWLCRFTMVELKLASDTEAGFERTFAH